MSATTGIVIERLDAEGARRVIVDLSEVLCDCVEGGASVGFLAPLEMERADGFWRNVAEAVARGERLLFVARDDGGRIQGTVQVVVGLPENQAHRGEIVKLLVHRRARNGGIGEALMVAAEGEAAAAGKTLLTLDTATAAAERLYQRLGWRRCGAIPDYAMNPDRSFCDTVVYWKRLR